MRNILLSVAVSCAVVSATSAGDTVHIRLPDQVQVHRHRARLSDIAELTATNSELIRSLGALDITEIGAQQQEQTIRREQIQLRLMLAGVDPNSITLTGADAVSVQYTPFEPWTDERLRVELQALWAQSLGAEQGQIQLQLTSPFVATLPPVQRNSLDLRLEPVQPSRLALGHAFTGVKIWDSQQLTGVRKAHCYIRRRYHVLTAARALERSHVLQPGDVVIEEQFLDHPPESWEGQEWTGLRLTRSISRGEALSKAAVVRSQVRSAATLIRPRDSVQVIARAGNVQVTLQDAEALQGGNAGDGIRVRNVASNSILSGIVRADGRVEILLR